MTPERAKIERDKADRLLSAYNKLEQAAQNLAFVNKWVKSGKVWQPKFKLHDGGHYTNDITMDVIVPAEIIQQQAVDAWKAAKRAYILAGGEF